MKTPEPSKENPSAPNKHEFADTLGVSVEAIEAGIQHMEDVGFSDGLHTGPVHPVQ